MKHSRLIGLTGILLGLSLLFLAPFISRATTLLSDAFTGTTINVSNWSETDAGGVGGTSGNVTQNGNLSLTGSATWGTNYLLTVPTYDRTAGDVSMDLDMTCSSGSSIAGVGYGDPGVLSGGGVSYTLYMVSNAVHFSRQLSNSNAEDVLTAFSCTNNVAFHVKITVASTTGATLFINGSSTAAVTGGTFTNKGFFLSGHSGTATLIDNVVISSGSAATAPDAPTGLGATPASTQMALTWTAPVSNGGAAITNYLVEYKATSSGSWLTFAHAATTTTLATVTSLTNGQGYDFRVSAVNSVGTSTPSSTVTATPALSVASAPQTLTATNGESGQSSLSWIAPISNGGASITDYSVQFKLSTEPTNWTTFADGVSTIASTTVTGLTNGSAYNFRVFALNSVGTSTASNVATGTPSSAILTDSFTGTTIDSSKWTEVDATGLGGSAGAVRQNGALTIVPGNASWSAQDGLKTVATYDRTSGDVSMQVAISRDSCGSGVGPAVFGYGDMDFTTGGSASYILLSNTTTWELYYWLAGSNQTGSPQVLSGLTSCTNGVPITFKLTALQAGGASIFINGSGVAAATISTGTFTNKQFWIGSYQAGGTVTYDDVAIFAPTLGPFAPTGLSTTPGNNQMGLTWTAGGDNGAAITDYVIEYKIAASSSWTTFADGTSTGTSTTVTGLTNGTSYNFRVSAVNTNGTSTPSSTATAIPFSTTPAAPTANTVSISGTPAIGETVVGTYTFSDANGDSEATSLYRWLIATSAGGSYTAIPGATSNSYVIGSGDLGKYLKFEVTPVSSVSPTTGSAVLSSASTQISEVDYINLILSTGQSLSVGVNASPALSTTQPYSNLMLTGGAGGIGLGTSFTPLIESSVETMSSGMANTITANSTSAVDVAVALHGVSGFTYSQLKKGTGPYANGMTQLTNAQSAATTLGRAIRVLGVTTIHGETDSFNGVTGPQYQGYLEEWQHDYETDVHTITGQTGTVPLFLDQMSSYPSSYANMATSAIPIYELKASEDNPGKIILVGPKYYYNYSDRHHLTAASSRWDGEYYGKVINKVSINHETWRPLSPDSAIRSGNVIYANFHVPAGQLAFDTTLVSPRTNKGFEYYDSSSSASISSVQIYDTDTVKITLSGTPTGSNQRLRYAYTGIPGTDTGAQNAGSAAGNLRDTDTYPSLYGNTLYDWAVHFDQPITVDSSAPILSSISSGSLGSHSATISWTTDEAATSKIEYGITSSYGTTTGVSDSGGVTSHTINLANLVSCADYHYRVISADLVNNTATSSNNVFTTAGCTGNATVVASTTSSVTTGSGATVSLTTSSVEGITVVVPPSFTSTTTSAVFQTKKLNKSEFFGSIGSPSTLTAVGSYVYNLKALIDATTTLSTFTQPITVTLAYDPAALGTVPESTLVIYRYDGSSWYQLSNCTVDTAAHTVSCTTTAFSDFSVFGQAPNVVVSSGSSSGGGGSRARTVGVYTAPVNATTTTPKLSFTKDLQLGDISTDVKLLQQFLNANGFVIAATGPGSTGNETSKFGAATKSALIKFQISKGILPATGRLGPATRSVLSGGIVIPTQQASTATVFTKDLGLGMNNSDVKSLQDLLIKYNLGDASATLKAHGANGNFGNMTKSALIEFQVKNGILPATGYFGPKTRAFIAAH